MWIKNYNDIKSNSILNESILKNIILCLIIPNKKYIYLMTKFYFEEVAAPVADIEDFLNKGVLRHSNNMWENSIHLMKP